MLLKILVIGDVANYFKTVSKYVKNSKIHIINFPKDGPGLFTYDENFHASTKLINLISPAIILLSITNIICGYLISEKCYSFIKYFIIIVILFAAITIIYSKTLLVFIYMFFTMCLLIFIVSMLNLIILNSKKTLMKIK